MRFNRRKFAKRLAILGAAPMAAARPTPAARDAESECLPIHELKLPPDVFADLKSYARPVLAQARYLEQLPLQGVEPGFVFVPR